MKLKYPLKLPLKLPLFLRNWNAAMLASQIKFEAGNRWGGVDLDTLDFHIRSVRPGGPLAWEVRAKCWNESRTGFGGADFVTLRSQRGFATVDGALGALSEVASNIAVVYPDMVLVLHTPDWILKRFDAGSMAWKPFLKRSWECRSCDERLTLTPLFWYGSKSPLCHQCEKMMHEVDNPKSVIGVPGPEA